MEQTPTIENFYREHAMAVFAYCVSLCRDRVWAEDLMQDTFVKATRAIGGYRGGDPKSWLFAIARNTFIDQTRRRRPLPVADIEESSVADPDVAEIDAIERALQSLPDRQRTALLLADRGGLPPAEVAAILGITPGAAKVLVHRARIRFREVYEESDV